MHLLPGCFRHLDAAYALELLQHKMTRHVFSEELTASELRTLFTPIDLDRLHNYVRSIVDFQVVSDLLPRLAGLYFDKRLPSVRINKTQQIILLGLGLQHKSVERLASEFATLLGSGSDTALEKRHRLPGINVPLLQTEKVKPISGGLASFEMGGKLNKPGVSNTTGWAKRVRGLLFVVVRELVQSLDAIVGTKTSPCSDSALVLPPNLVASSVRGNVTLSLDRPDNSSENSSDSDTSEIDKPVKGSAVDVENAESTILDGTVLPESELQRRADVVRQLLSEEISSGGGPLGSLNHYKVRGSESDWAKAIVGHGSALESLNVVVPKSKKPDGKKKNRLSLEEELPRKRKNIVKLKKAKGTPR
ncbi:unnamed protein product [Dicrocoelium dendriticum]|nr:unnamed protein product [Dicrocoelium dendriticum]